MNHLITGNTINPQRALLLIHGRGASAAGIMRLAEELTLTGDCILIAPQAPGHSWYPERFIAPTVQNQPYLDSALTTVHDIMSELQKTHNITPDRITLAGFSQGACLVSEYVKRHPTRYRGVGVLSGGLIGTDEEATTDFVGDLAGTPVYLGCDETDWHIPADRVTRTAELFTNHGADVSLQLYEGLGHAVHPDGLRFIEQTLT